VLHLELGLHAESSSLFDYEGLALESLDGARGPQVDDDIGPTFDFEAEREDDAFARIVGVGDVCALAETERGLPLLERLVVLVCHEEVSMVCVHWACSKDIPSFWYSSIVFFSPTLKPSVCSACRSSWWSAMSAIAVV
jgi:hypothetical protein